MKTGVVVGILVMLGLVLFGVLMTLYAATDLKHLNLHCTPRFEGFKDPFDLSLIQKGQTKEVDAEVIAVLLEPVNGYDMVVRTGDDVELIGSHYWPIRRLQYREEADYEKPKVGQRLHVTIYTNYEGEVAYEEISIYRSGAIEIGYHWNTRRIYDACGHRQTIVVSHATWEGPDEWREVIQPPKTLSEADVAAKVGKP